MESSIFNHIYGDQLFVFQQIAICCFAVVYTIPFHSIFIFMIFVVQRHSRRANWFSELWFDLFHISSALECNFIQILLEIVTMGKAIQTNDMVFFFFWFLADEESVWLFSSDSHVHKPAIPRERKYVVLFIERMPWISVLSISHTIRLPFSRHPPSPELPTSFNATIATFWSAFVNDVMCILYYAICNRLLFHFSVIAFFRDCRCTCVVLTQSQSVKTTWNTAQHSLFDEEK